MPGVSPCEDLFSVAVISWMKLLMYGKFNVLEVVGVESAGEASRDIVRFVLVD